MQILGGVILASQVIIKGLAILWVRVGLHIPKVWDHKETATIWKPDEVTCLIFAELDRGKDQVVDSFPAVGCEPVSPTRSNQNQSWRKPIYLGGSKIGWHEAILHSLGRHGACKLDFLWNAANDDQITVAITTKSPQNDVSNGGVHFFPRLPVFGECSASLSSIAQRQSCNP